MNPRAAVYLALGRAEAAAGCTHCIGSEQPLCTTACSHCYSCLTWETQSFHCGKERVIAHLAVSSNAAVAMCKNNAEKARPSQSFPTGWLVGQGYPAYNKIKLKTKRCSPCVTALTWGSNPGCFQAECCADPAFQQGSYTCVSRAACPLVLHFAVCWKQMGLTHEHCRLMECHPAAGRVSKLAFKSWSLRFSLSLPWFWV